MSRSTAVAALLTLIEIADAIGLHPFQLLFQHLFLTQIRVVAAGAEEFGVGALLDDAAAFQDGDVIGREPSQRLRGRTTVESLASEAGSSPPRRRPVPRGVAGIPHSHCRKKTIFGCQRTAGLAAHVDHTRNYKRQRFNVAGRCCSPEALSVFFVARVSIGPGCAAGIELLGERYSQACRHDPNRHQR
jgi:hypothetical protein